MLSKGLIADDSGATDSSIGTAADAHGKGCSLESKERGSSRHSRSYFSRCGAESTSASASTPME